MANSLAHSRTTRVVCDKCRTESYVTVGKLTGLGGPVPTEDQWDTLVVEQMRRLGWRCGKEPAAHHQRIQPDVCPDCVGKGAV